MENLDPLAILKTMHQPLVVLDSDLVVKGANRAFYTTFKVEPDETEGVAIYDLGNAQWDIPKLRDLLRDILPNSGSVERQPPCPRATTTLAGFEAAEVGVSFGVLG